MGTGRGEGVFGCESLDELESEVRRLGRKDRRERKPVGMGGSLFSGRLGSAFGSAPLSAEAMGCYAVGFDLDEKSGGLRDWVDVCDKEPEVVVLYPYAKQLH